MKKIIFTLAILVCSFSYFAQLNKGRMLLGGSYNYYQTSNSNSDTSTINQHSSNWTSFGVSLRYGYFVSDNVAVGLFGSFSQGSQKSDYKNASSSYSSYNSLTQYNNIGAFSRYYKMLGKSRFALFGQLSVSYMSGTTNNSSSNYYTSGPVYNSKTKSASSGINANISPGITYFASNKIGLEMYFGNVGFNSQTTKNYRDNTVINQNTTSTFNSNLKFDFSTLFIGVNFYFGGKKSETASAK